MKNRYRLVRIAFGSLLIVVGLIGLLLPILPGIYFIVAGAILLAEDVPALRRRIEKLEDRYPAVHNAILRLRSPDGSVSLPRFTLVLVCVTIIVGAILYFVLQFLKHD